MSHWKRSSREIWSVGVVLTAALLACKGSPSRSGGASASVSASEGDAPSGRNGGSFRSLQQAEFEQRAKRAGWTIEDSSSWNDDHHLRGLRMSLEKGDLYVNVELVDLSPGAAGGKPELAIGVGETSYLVLTLNLDEDEEKPDAKAELAKLGQHCAIDACTREKLTAALSAMGWSVTGTDFDPGAQKDWVREDVLTIDGKRKEGFGYIELEHRSYARLAEKRLIARDGPAFLKMDLCLECGDKPRKLAKELARLAR